MAKKQDAKKIVETVVNKPSDEVPESPFGTVGETVVPREKAEAIKTELNKINNTPPPDSAMAVIEKTADKGETVESDQGVKFDGVIDKPTAERLANRLNALTRGEEVDLKSLADTVVSQIEELHREKSRRSQQNLRTIAALRAADPKGKKTCGRCAFRVDLDKMDAKEELCEVCSS